MIAFEPKRFFTVLIVALGLGRLIVRQMDGLAAVPAVYWAASLVVGWVAVLVVDAFLTATGWPRGRG